MENLSAARALLSKQHEHYTRSVSSKGMALSLETAALVWTLCNNRYPQTIVDLGSGFSSYVIRSWAKTFGQRPVIWSVDDDPTWLTRSAQYCKEQDVDVSNFTTWDVFMHTQLKFDIILYDLGRMQVRFENICRALDLCSSNGIVVIDDMHKFNYRKEVERVLLEKGFKGVDMSATTTDAHEGRHCWIATR